MEKRSMTEKNWKLLNGLALAYMGDGIYEVYVRNHVMQKGLTKPNQLHATATKFVSAKAQARLMQKMLEQENFLNEEELEIYKRGRNSKSHTVAKNADVGTYRIATGFEALMGYLYLSGQQDRLEELINWCLQQVEGEQ
ncbi:MAG: Mini-ribonuclease 3 [Streptococcus sp.]|nr:Mini-ribonuclease 3 [Streptococcus sp.]